MAQIDLAEVAAKAGKTAMPDKGSLAFFVGGEAAVVFVPEGQSDAPVMPPAGTPDLTEYGGASDWRTDLAGQPLYPYWPVDFAVLDVPLPASDDDCEAVEAFHAAEVAAVEKLFPRRKYSLSPDQAFAGPPIPSLVDAHRASRPRWWFMAIHYVARLQEATRLGVPAAMEYRRDNLAVYRKLLDKLQPTDALAAFRRMLGPKSAEVTKLEADIAKAEAKLAELRRLEPVFRTFVQETSDWTKARDPWSLMRPADIEQLDGRMKRVREEFKDFDAYVPHRREELETSTLLAMASADERGYAALPEPVQTLINCNYLLPSGGWHQMFGRGIEIQGDSCAMREEGYIMLLQLTYDDLMHWSFGDNGCYQFWISPADLARRNWAGAKMTLECH